MAQNNNQVTSATAINAGGENAIFQVKRSPHKKKGRDTLAKKAAKSGPRERLYPRASLEDVLPLGKAIHRIAGRKIRRLTLFEKINRSPSSGSSRAWIVQSAKYKVTVGTERSEYLELTDDGFIACDDSQPARLLHEVKFRLGIMNIPPFRKLYEAYVGQRIPVRDVMRDLLLEEFPRLDTPESCVDLFLVNAKYLQLLRTIAGAETLIPLEQALEGLPQVPAALRASEPRVTAAETEGIASGVDWSRMCFYISPIGKEHGEERKHADLFLNSLVRPAMEEIGLTVVRADEIPESGMIATQIYEHICRCGLAISDLSLGSQNVFYETALRHASRLPVVHIIRKGDVIPFDVNQMRAVIIDTTDIYTLVPKIETYRAEIAAQARKALEDPLHSGNPITTFYPQFWDLFRSNGSTLDKEP